MRRCGICRGTGHNRQTCQKNTMRVTTPSVSQPNSDNVVQTVSRTASGRRKASCSYCRSKFYKVDRTHTCRTCPTRKTDLLTWIEENKIWVKEHKSKMMQMGLGIGCLVQYGERFIEINHIEFDHISKSSSGGYYGKRLDEDDYNRFFRSRVYVTDELLTVVSPIPAQMVAAQFPKDWENGTYGIPVRLKDSKRTRKTKTK